MAVVREAKAKQVRYADIRTIVLHPHICSYLATNLLILCVRVSSIGELVWHWATHKDFPSHTSRRLFHLNWYADIEGTSDPRTLVQDEAAIIASQPEVVCRKSRNRPYLLPKILIEGVGQGYIGKLADDIVFMAGGRLVRDWASVEELECFGHSRRITARPRKMRANAVIVRCCSPLG